MVSCLAMLTIDTRVWYAITAPDGSVYATAGTVVNVPSRASGNYTVLSDDQEVFQRYHALPIDVLTVIPRRSERLQGRSASPGY